MKFSKQPGFCCVCGKPGFYEPHSKFGFICLSLEADCIEEYNWRYTLHVLGKEYYPDPKKNEKV